MRKKRIRHETNSCEYDVGVDGVGGLPGGVTAYQWGRKRAPLYQSAEPVTQEFYLTK